jgi:hypothetical protein
MIATIILILTCSVEIDVTNGLIAVTFQTQTSDVSIIMK